MEQDVKIYEKPLEKRLRDIVKIDEKQFGFQSGKSTVDAIFELQQLQEKFRGKKKELFLVFVDLEKAFDHVPREASQWDLKRQKCLSVSYSSTCYVPIDMSQCKVKDQDSSRYFK